MQPPWALSVLERAGLLLVGDDTPKQRALAACDKASLERVLTSTAANVEADRAVNAEDPVAALR
jgi:hypothetical protein